MCFEKESNHMTRIVPVNTKPLFRSFLDFPHRLYRGNRQYVPPLDLMQKQLLLPEQNPFFRQAESAYFLAADDQGIITGRIAAIYNKTHLDLYQDDTGFFGLFDSIPDKTTAGLLLRSAAGWLRAKGIRRMTGPENLGTNDSVGILTKGFDRPPVFLMPYNFPYYRELLEENGMSPVMTLYSYLLPKDGLPAELQGKGQYLEKRLEERGIRIRCIDLRNYRKEIENLRPVYNNANTGNWGFLPLDETGFSHMADDLKKIVKPHHILIAEKEHSVIGYAVSVPDYNQVFRKIPRGRLFPFGWYTLLRERKNIKGFRIMILGVLPAYRGQGIDWCLYARIARTAIGEGMQWGEAGYVMEQNVPMNRMLKALEAERAKEYRLYSMEI